MAGITGLEPVLSALTGQRLDQFVYIPHILNNLFCYFLLIFRSHLYKFGASGKIRTYLA